MAFGNIKSNLKANISLNEIRKRAERKVSSQIDEEKDPLTYVEAPEEDGTSIFADMTLGDYYDPEIRRIFGDLKSKTNPFGYVDIITFCENEFFLGGSSGENSFRLHPWQKIILKIFYMGQPGNENLKVEDSPERKCSNCVWQGNTLSLDSPCLTCSICSDDTRKNQIDRMFKGRKISEAEKEELESLVDFKDSFMNEWQMIHYDLGGFRDKDGNLCWHESAKDAADDKTKSRIRVRDQIVKKIGKKFKELVLVLGRRAGKSLMTSILCLYELYRLLEMGDPHAFYGINNADLISLLNVAVSKDQAKDAVFTKMQGMVLQSAYFQSKVNKKGIRAQDISFFTIADYRKKKELLKMGISDSIVEGSIQIFSGTSNSASQVGRTLYAVVLDEVAAMIQNTDSKMSDFELYNKLKPSMATFVPHGGRIVCISNPGTETGLLWKLYNDALDPENEDILMFQLPTELVNPGVDKADLESERKKDPDVYMMMYEAEFSGGAAEPLIPQMCIDKAYERGNLRQLYRTEYGTPNVRYFAHADPAISSDNYAFAIVHGEDVVTEYGVRRRIILDHVMLWVPEPDKPVSVDIVDDYITEMCHKFNIVSVTLDSWESAHSTQKMQRIGIPARIVNFNGRYNEEIYKTLRQLFTEDRIDLYDEPWDWAMETKSQIKNLQKRYNRFGMRVQAAYGYHDDIPDCIAAASYACVQDSSVGQALPSIRLSRMNIDPSDRYYATRNTSLRTGKGNY